MAWLIKRGQTFIVRWYDQNGKQVQRSTGTSDRATAHAIQRDVERQLALGKFGIFDPPPVLSLAEAWVLFVSERRSDWDADTVKLYDWAGKRLAQAFPDLLLRDLTAAMLAGLVSGWRERGELADTSTVIWWRHVRSFLNHSTSAGRCDALVLPMPSVRRRAERVRVFSAAELERFWTCCPGEEARTLFQVMLLTGARLGHACALIWDDVDDGQGLLYFRAAYGKGGKPHEIELFPTLKAVLEKYGQNRARTGRLWRFGKWRARRLFESARDAAGLPAGLTPHCLRHTAAAGWLARGVPIYDVSKLLNHSSVAVTERHYGHLKRGRQAHWLNQSDISDSIKSMTELL